MMAVAQVDRWRARRSAKRSRFVTSASRSQRASVKWAAHDRPIPFRLRGDIVNAVWHVVDGHKRVSA